MTKPKTLDQLPHFHVLCPIRSIEQNGKWGLKQRRVYELDEDGNRIRDQNGEFKTVRDDLHRLWKVKSCVDTAARFNERTEEQMFQNRPQTRHKKEELSR